MKNRRHALKHFLVHFFTAKRRGHGVHSPFVFSLCEEVFYNPSPFYDFEKLSLLRRELLNNRTQLDTGNFGAGSAVFNSGTRTVKDLVKYGTSSKKRSELYYRLINFLGSKSIIELGTSIGLNSLYLALANPLGKVVTAERSLTLSNFATSLANKVNAGNIRFINGDFDDVFSDILNANEPADLILVDGNHRYESTIRYFNQILQKKNPQLCVIFDDIYWSEEMTRAWKEISSHPEARITIDAFYFGMVFFSEDVRERVELRLFI